MAEVVAAMPAPDGYVVDFDNPQRQGYAAAYWFFGVGMFFSLLFTGQRIYVKCVMRAPWHLDDTLIAVSWIFSVISQALVVRSFADKIQGIHAWEMPIDSYNGYLLNVWIASILYVVAGSSTKIALLVFYLRISPQQWLRTSVFVSIAIITLYSVALMASLIFACDPVEKAFNVSMAEGHCNNMTSAYIATAACNIGSDVLLFLLPIPMVFGLQMPMKQKLSLFVIFAIGSATVITSIIRAVILPPMLLSSDITWDVTWPAVLIIVESNLIIICGMLPTLRKFVRHVAPRLISDQTAYGGGRLADDTKEGAGGAGGKSSHSHSLSKPSRGLIPMSPGLVTFGSLPSRGQMSGGGVRGGYAKFGTPGPDGYALETLHQPCGSEEDITNASPDGLLHRVAHSDLKVGVVDTVVVGGGRKSNDWDEAGHHGHSGGWMSSGSESGAPVVTTHIEVTYEGAEKGAAGDHSVGQGASRGAR